ncbi:CHAT domain-containing protein [Actinokineospora xionganensis]|uniref:CHAT domain-containing protein n=1 Tax=Actinokineospora xionganensis TaxID=2684470 RepID=A0ABR7LE07_9PSEU|nr:CHAT domain-containing protein [Actinokineospora xionganensis]MBC6450940.1 CHAT domain-containing protein [Actinokineospora xionganensis]
MLHSEREQLVRLLTMRAHTDVISLLRSRPPLGWWANRQAKRLRKGIADAIARQIPPRLIAAAMLQDHNPDIVLAAMTPLIADNPAPEIAASVLLEILLQEPDVGTPRRRIWRLPPTPTPPSPPNAPIGRREPRPDYGSQRPVQDRTPGDIGGWGTGVWRPPWLNRPSDPAPVGTVTPGEPPDDFEPFEDFSTDPPSVREVWPTLECPASVDIDEQFDLTVGIGPKQDMALLGTGSIILPDQRVRLEIVLMYDPTAFAPVGWSNPVILTVGPANPYPVTTLRMTALRGESLRSRRDIGASFYVDGALRGYASRAIEVTGTPSGTVALFGGALLDIGPLLEHEAPDLVVVVERGEDLRGQTLLWSTRSSVSGVASAPGPYRSEIGEDPAAFARRVRLDVGAYGGDARGSTLKLIGVGRAIADHIPDEVCAALTAASAARYPDPATVLLLSSEPHVPWELAVLDPPPAVGSPFLGARMAIGRWVLARKRPRPTPPTEVRADRHIVVTARYEGVPGWARLPHAEAEAERLRLTYPPAVEVQPLHSAVLDCLEAGPDGGVLHFALHGKYDPENAQDGLVLLAPSEANPERLVPRFLQPDQVSAMAFSAAPFVFLNACQVGAAGEVLGDYSGLAKAFLAAGAAGVVAPLWNVNDEAASALADAFYRDAYGPQALAPAEILRRARAEVSRDHYPTWPATTLAYQFFGHPRLRLRRDQGA